MWLVLLIPGLVFTAMGGLGVYGHLVLGKRFSTPVSDIAMWVILPFGLLLLALAAYAAWTGLRDE